MKEFSLENAHLDLPVGAIARGYRRIVRYRGRPVLGFTQGPHRAYLYPVYSPGGSLLTSESPADHPHHNSIWVAADHIRCMFPIEGDRSHEDGTYCFYVNETFQGRAPGRIEEMDCQAEELTPTTLRVTQRLRWIGPEEWGTPLGKHLVSETRTTIIDVVDSVLRVIAQSRIEPANWDISIGPTRHAYFGIRVAESMQVRYGGAVAASNGLNSIAETNGSMAEWIDYSGPVGGGQWGGITMIPGKQPPAGPWFITDWGTVAVNPFLSSGITIKQGESLECSLTLIFHDGPADVDLIRDVSSL